MSIKGGSFVIAASGADSPATSLSLKPPLYYCFLRWLSSRGAEVRVEHQAIDGGIVEFEGDLDLSAPATSCATFEVANMLYEFTSGGRDYAAQAVEASLGPIDYRESYGLYDGTLRIGRPAKREAGDQTLIGVWESERHSMFTHLYGGGLDAILRLFGLFEIAESDAGLEVMPSDLAAATQPFTDWRYAPAYPPCVMKFLPGAGVVEVVKATRQSQKKLPRWAGTDVRGGELFSAGTGPNDRYFVMANDSAQSQLVPFEVDQAETALNAFAALRVEWKL